ncbi:MAG: hypothetical protein LPK21_04055, partial [Hymenobacteraceae bacterium]|nr:hypothetical protein [Hymenobacteraceae bacterium]
MNHKLLLFLCLLLMLPFLSVASCGCGGDRTLTKANQQEIFNRSDAVFIGKVVAAKGIPNHPELVPDTYDFTFSIQKYIKGKPAADSTFVVRKAIGCCDNDYRLGEEWLVVAHLERDSMLHASVCTPTAQIIKGALQKADAIVFQLFLANKLEKQDKTFLLAYTNGKPAVKGNLKSGSLHGKMQFLNEAGIVERQEAYNNGVMQEYIRLYRDSGKIMEKN